MDNPFVQWLAANRQWVFSGIGVLALTILGGILRWFFSRRRMDADYMEVKAASDGNSPIAAGKNIEQNINSFNKTTLSTAVSDRRYEEWQELIQKFPKIIENMSYAFSEMRWQQGGIIDVDADPEYQKPLVAVVTGNRLIHSRLYIADVFESSGLLAKWNELVTGVGSGDFERPTLETGYSAISRFMRKSQTFTAELARVAREDLKRRS
jgi:hypothetical protein